MLQQDKLLLRLGNYADIQVQEGQGGSGGKRGCMSLFDLIETSTLTLCESHSRLNCSEGS
jgi:hypothetical protein